MTSEPASPAPARPRMHHAVFALHPHSFEEASRYLTDLGFEFVELVLDDIGLRVRIDWAGGMELVTPTESHRNDSGSVGDFLDHHGEGLFTVALRVLDAERASLAAQSAGSQVLYRQNRSGPELELTEIQMSPLHGVPITFLQTDLD